MGLQEDSYQGFLGRPKDKFELREYLSQINFRDEKKLEEKAEEIVGNIFEGMERYLWLKPGNPLRAYYELPLKQVEMAYALKDFKRELPLAISHLLSSINWE
ncbi:hypothetical protein JXB28_05740 [Candidatus Woesearchaeota archaeon]|nr:hypothetical protein [Candidatus Woesearchaeota archaeon]